MAKINSLTQQTWCVCPQICKWGNPDDVKVIYCNGAVCYSIENISFPSTRTPNYVLFAPKTIRSREQKFQVWNFRSLERSLPGTLAPLNFRSHQWIQKGAKIPTNV